MRASRIIVLALAGLIAVAAAASWLVPGYLDWNRYRGEIEAFASAAIGRPVRIGGAITLHLLPEPTLTAAQLQVEDAGDGAALSARGLQLRVALGPLLAGRLDARSVVLDGPDLRIAWPLPPGLLLHRPAWLRTATVAIRDGTLRVGGLTFSHADAELATDRDTGTLTAAGAAALGGHTWRFTARLARPGRDGAAGIEATLDGEGQLQNTGGRVSGTIAADGTLAGRVSGRGRNLALLVPAPAVAWQASGSLSAAGGLLVADDLALDLGGSPARGVLALRVGKEARLDLALAASRLDLDAWLPVLARAPHTVLPTGIDLSAEAATLAGGVLQHLRGGFDLAGGTTHVRDLSVSLPGDARVTLHGSTTSGISGFDGSATLTAPDLHATLQWLAPFAPGLLAAIPHGALRQADMAAHVTLATGQVSLTGLHGSLDGAAVAGGLGWHAGAPPLLSADLTFDRLRLDPWLPSPGTLATSYPWPGVQRHFAGLDADLTVHAPHASWAGLALDAFALAAHFDRHGAKIERLSAHGQGVALSLSGQIGAAGRMTDGTLTATASDAAVLRSWLPETWPGRALLSGAASLRLHATGLPAALALRVAARLGDLRFDAQPMVNLPSGRWAGPVTLRHPGAARLLTALAGVNPESWLGEGSLSLVTEAAVTPGEISLSNIALTAGALHLSGAASLRFAAMPWRIMGTFRADPLTVPAVPWHASQPLPLGALRGWEAGITVEASQILVGRAPALGPARLALGVRNGVARLDLADAHLADGVLSGHATLNSAADPPAMQVDARLTGAQLDGPLLGSPLDLTTGTTTAQMALSARGYSPAALLSTLSGTAAATLRDGVVAGFDLAGAGSVLSVPAGAGTRETGARAALGGGQTAFSALDLAATLRDGVATVSAAHLTGPSGTATAAGSVDLSGQTLDLHLALQPNTPAGAPSLGVTLEGPTNAPRRAADLAALTRWTLAQDGAALPVPAGP